jgi:hypothetical protein
MHGHDTNNDVGKRTHLRPGTTLPVQRFWSFKTENGSYIRTRNVACAVPSVTFGNIGWKMRWLSYGVTSDC